MDDPQLFVEGFSRFDVEQGELGDCWLLAAVANLAMNPNLFTQVVPEDQSFEENYAGIFHFRLNRSLTALLQRVFSMRQNNTILHFLDELSRKQEYNSIILRNSLKIETKDLPIRELRIDIPRDIRNLIYKKRETEVTA